jgi:hypothetical protein
MRTLAMYFELGELTEVIFNDGSSTDARISVRGKTGGPFRRAGSFQWTSAVKALSLLVLKTCSNPSDGLLRGFANSLAASLDYAISKQPLWLTEMFGCDQQGISFARRLILRTNPERKRPGPVTLGINQAYLPTSQVQIFFDGKRCTQEMLETLCSQLSQPMMPEEMLQSTAA